MCAFGVNVWIICVHIWCSAVRPSCDTRKLDFAGSWNKGTLGYDRFVIPHVSGLKLWNLVEIMFTGSV